MTPEQSEEQAISALLDYAADNGLTNPDVHYYRAINGKYVLEMGWHPEGERCVNGEPKRRSFRLSYQITDVIGTVGQHIHTKGAAVVEVLAAQRLTKH